MDLCPDFHRDYPMIRLGRSTRRINLSSLVCILFIAAEVLGAQSEQWTFVPGASYRSRVLDVKASRAAGFSRLTPFAFTNVVPEFRHLTNQILLNGSGVAAGDIDGDGWCDVLLAGMGGGTRLFHNQQDGTFRDVTEKS